MLECFRAPTSLRALGREPVNVALRQSKQKPRLVNSHVASLSKQCVFDAVRCTQPQCNSPTVFLRSVLESFSLPERVKSMHRLMLLLLLLDATAAASSPRRQPDTGHQGSDRKQEVKDGHQGSDGLKVKISVTRKHLGVNNYHANRDSIMGTEETALCLATAHQSLQRRQQKRGTERKPAAEISSSGFKSSTVGEEPKASDGLDTKPEASIVLYAISLSSVHAYDTKVAGAGPTQRSGVAPTEGLLDGCNPNSVELRAHTRPSRSPPLQQQRSVEKLPRSTVVDSGINDGERDSTPKSGGEPAGEAAIQRLETLYSRVSSLWDGWAARQEKSFRLPAQQPPASRGSASSAASPCERNLIEIDEALRRERDCEWLGRLPSGTCISSSRFAMGKFDEAGGELRLDAADATGSAATLCIPRGALSGGEAHLLYVGVVYEDGDGDEPASFTPAYECGPSGLKFLQPLRLHVLHCASEESVSRLSAYVRESGAESWQPSATTGVEFSSGGHAVLSIEHFTRFKISATLRGSGSGLVKNLYVCYFNCQNVCRLYYLNRDDYLLESIRENEIRRRGSEVRMSSVEFVAYEDCGSLLVDVLVDVEGTISKTLLKFEVSKVLRNSFDYVEVPSIGRIVSTSVRQENGGIACQFGESEFAREQQQPQIEQGGERKRPVAVRLRHQLAPQSEPALSSQGGTEAAAAGMTTNLPGPVHVPQPRGAESGGEAGYGPPGCRLAIIESSEGVETKQKDSAYISGQYHESADVQRTTSLTSVDQHSVPKADIQL